MEDIAKPATYRSVQIGTLLMIAALAVAVRVAANFVLAQPLESDSLAYFTMAQGLADRGELLDQFGQHAFYSAGYPLLLASFFELLGSNVLIALTVNMVLALTSLYLVFRIAMELSVNRITGIVAAIAYAFWLPAIWNATMMAKENLSTPLMLGLALCAIRIARNKALAHNGLLAGILWGASLLTGGSTLLLFSSVGVALIILWRLRDSFAPTFKPGLCFIVGTLVVLAPWLYATDRMVGRPVLTTNAAFNLYLGNNPAANGRFVSIADTPIGNDWEEVRTRLGEIGAADLLKAKALRWIEENPASASQLAIRKLGLFWQPNFPDASDFQASKAVAMVRIVEVGQYGIIVLLAFVAFRSKSVERDSKWILAVMIVGFWLIHAAAYIIPRYRDPIIPLLIILASIPVTVWLQKRWPFITERRHGT